MSEIEQKTVLRIVYEPLVGRVMERILSRNNMSLELIESSNDASKLVRDKLDHLLVDVVITDWTQVNGPGVIKSAQEKGVRKIIVINGGLITDSEVKELNELGVNIIPKPFEVAELINAIRGKVPTIESENA